MMNIVQGILESVCSKYTTFSIVSTTSSVFSSLRATLNLFLILIRYCHKTLLKIKCCPSQEHYVASVLQHNSSNLTPITLSFLYYCGGVRGRQMLLVLVLAWMVWHKGPLFGLWLCPSELGGTEHCMS